MNIEQLKQEFAVLGFSVVYYLGNKQSNGADLWVKKKTGKPLSVEVKKARKMKNGTVQISPVEIGRRRDDLIAIICNSEYVLIEPMKDHLKCCSSRGTRQLTILLGSK